VLYLTGGENNIGGLTPEEEQKEEKIRLTEAELIHELLHQAKKNAEVIHLLRVRNTKKDALMKKLEQLLNDSEGSKNC